MNKSTWTRLDGCRASVLLYWTEAYNRLGASLLPPCGVDSNLAFFTPGSSAKALLIILLLLVFGILHGLRIHPDHWDGVPQHLSRTAPFPYPCVSRDP